MSEPTGKMQSDATAVQELEERAAEEKPSWEAPEMQDVSEEVMAQPYIRFT